MGCHNGGFIVRIHYMHIFGFGTTIGQYITIVSELNNNSHYFGFKGDL